MKQILKKSNNAVVIYNNIKYSIDNCKNKFIGLLDGAYITPSYFTANHKDIVQAKQNGLWLELYFESTQDYKGLQFDGILVNIKPKYNFINLIRCQNDEYIGKCINYNLSINTTNLYNEIMGEIKNNNEK